CSTLWASEFLMGCAHDVYEAKLPDYLDGLLSFATLALILYQEYGIVPIATTGRNHLDMRLFPSRMSVKKIHSVFLLATYPDAVNQVESLSLPTLQKYQARIPNYVKIIDKWQAKSVTEKLRTTMRNSVASIGRHSNLSMLSIDSSRTKPEFNKAIEDMAKRRLTGNITRVLPCETEDDLKTRPQNDDDRLPPTDDSNQPHDSNAACLPSNAPSPNVPPVKPTSGDGHNTPLHKPSLPPLQPTKTSPTEETTTEPGAGGLPFKKPPVLTRSASLAFADFLSVIVPPNLSGHIILCGMPNALHDFVAPLRHQLDCHAKTAKEVKSTQTGMTDTPIVIISQILLTEKQHASIAMFHQVYFICGSPLQESVLRHASAYTAKSIVILGTCLQSKQRIDDDLGDDDDMAADTKDQNMLDTDAITLHRYVVEFCECNCPKGTPMTTVIVELVSDDLVRAESPATLQAVKALTKRVLSRADDPLDNICHPIYAAGWPSFVHRFDSSCPGKVFISNSLDAVLGSCNKYGCIIDLLHLLTFGEGASNESGRVLDQIAVPLAYQDKSYLECFVQMLVTQVSAVLRCRRRWESSVFCVQDILCLGLYRARSKRHSYVYVNPNEDVRVQYNDRLFVLR
ncbi:hypothetical protein DYB32_006092, partial [Aphanomyces invadans]